MNHDKSRLRLALPKPIQRPTLLPTVAKLSIIFLVSILSSAIVANTPALAAPQSYTCTYYLVRRGDTLTTIGRRYGVTVQMMMSANGMRSTRIYSGRSLCIPRYTPVTVVRRPPHNDMYQFPYNPFNANNPYNNPYNVYNPCISGSGVRVIAINGVPVDQVPYNSNCLPPNVVYTPPPPAYNAFPCTKGYFNASNLCILQPYPVKVGSTAYAVWNISDFTYGEFDMGDGRGFVGPITHEQQVAIPNVMGPRLIQLRWQDHAGNWQYDSMTLQVVP